MTTSLASCILALALQPHVGWSGQQVTAGDLTVLIDEIPEVTQLNENVPVHVILENGGNAPRSGTVEIRDLVDATRVVGASRKPFTVGPGAKATLDFAIVFGEGTYSALYPVHAYVDFQQEGRAMSAHAVRIVTTNLAQADQSFPDPTPMEANVVPDRGAVPLWTLNTQRVAWQYFDGPMQYKRAGWTGSDAVCRANMDGVTVTRGDTRPSINMHPPWVPRAGTIFCDYLLKLPRTTPLKLTFANAIRDNTPQEPPSDGVLFRVWAAKGIAGDDAKLLYEDFTAAKKWVAGEADLSPYAGQTILLRLESNPGPKRDTTCDSSYWAEPTVVAGPELKPTGPTFAEAAASNVALGRRILSGEARADDRLTFIVGKGPSRVVAVLRPTPRGIADGVLSLVGPKSAVSFDGFNIDVLGQHAVRWPTAIGFRSYEARQENGRAVHVHHLEKDGRPLDLTLTVWADGDGLRIAYACGERVTDFALGRSDQPAPAVYYGHGYRILDPRPFRASFGGHDLATSHVGCDFAGGMSVLQAVDVPPDYFEVQPDARQYALHTHMNGTLTLVPSEAGAFDCAIKYRPLYDKKPAGGVERLAGRFCFDIWGGRYADIAARMADMIRYGLTDSFLTVHVWQRWGYDYRLPDIWPPDPSMGTIEDMRKIAEVCGKQDIPWGLHDNYIDFYPDAEGYTYDPICFTPNGEPIKAWYNQGREAQSYRWRPDEFMPFLQRNLKAIKEGVAPTHYFIDVFTSIGCIDFYDRDGRFHSSTETRQRWGDAFAWIRDYLGGNAPTTSEAGDDQLIGYLDGADCQHLTLSSTPGEFTVYRPCEDWERVPWYDAVNHARFILHGVGYSGRYEGGRGRRDHGINSDDYISCEALEGHALMVDAGCWGRAAVRKYWLLQDVARALALKHIASIEMAGGDMHRLIVTWSNGTRVYVNRGQTDWSVAGHVLPQYGYAVEGGGVTSAIEKRDGVFCESSTGPGGWYCDSRTFEPERGYRIEPRIEDFKYLGDRQFSWDVVWKADQPAPRAMTVFVHFYSPTAQRRDRIAFQDDHRPEPATNEWRGTIRYSRTITVPEDAEGDYVVGFGIYDSGGRLPLMGQPVPQIGGNAIWVGTLTVRREGGRVAGISFAPAPPAAPPSVRSNTEGRPAEFGFAVTDGAFRVQKIQNALRLTPLPDSPAFQVTLHLDAFRLKGASVEQVTARDDQGRESSVEFSQRGDDVSFRHDGKAFCYDVRL
jgi:hypothetical protein